MALPPGETRAQTIVDVVLSSRQQRAAKAESLPFGFVHFWKIYPRKVGKGAALNAWLRVKPDLDAVDKALTWQRRSPEWTKDGGAFVPHPTTYLNQRRWEDEPFKASSVAPPVSQRPYFSGKEPK